MPYYALESLEILFYGLCFAIVVGVPLAVLMARVKPVDWALDLPINALYATPMVALVPLLVLWFGIYMQAKIIVVFLFAVFPILINTYQGVRECDKNMLEVARSFRSPEWQMWQDVLLPFALPYIAAGIRLAIGRGLVGMVIAEFYTTITGLGYMITRYANMFETDKTFVPVHPADVPRRRADRGAEMGRAAASRRGAGPTHDADAHEHIDRDGHASSPAARHARSAAPRIRVRGLAKRYGALEVFRGIDFDLGEREIVTIVGPSGCGKTTLLRCIDGLLPVDGGEIWCGGERVTEPIAGMAMVFQHFGLFPWKTVYDNVAYGLRMAGASSRRDCRAGAAFHQAGRASPASSTPIPTRCRAACSSAAGWRARSRSSRACC